MKKLTSLFVILALLMLCACGSKTGATADGTTADGATADGATAPDSSDIPEVCRVYEDYVLTEQPPAAGVRRRAGRSGLRPPVARG